MSDGLRIAIGQFSDKGRKSINQDFHGAMIPEAPLLSAKGIAAAVADGISSSNVSQIASESAVAGFLSDYYCTSDAWSVRMSASRVIAATNSWLYAQSRRGPHAGDLDKGYVCTLSALVLQSTTAHVFHVGDSRVYRLLGDGLEQLTSDHRVAVSSDQSYLSRALGMQGDVEIDYASVPLVLGDVFLLTTDGVHEYMDARFCARTIADNSADLDQAAALIGAEALRRGSLDNLTAQIIRIDALPHGDAHEAMGQAEDLPPPPLLEPRMRFDGYTIVRSLHASSRSHLYLAIDHDTEQRVALKIPSIDLRGDAAYLKQFMMEEWVARRINNAHVLKPSPPARRRNFLYVAMEFIEGQTLTQWMADHPHPDLETVRTIAEQIARGLRAFHRMEMLHQDLRPDNIMIDKAGTVKIIDFGSVLVTGVADADRTRVLGTVQYTAPEYFLGEGGTTRSDIYSLGTIIYHMLTGRLPYGAHMARARTRSQQRRVTYLPAQHNDRTIPAWIDGALRKAVHPDPFKRYEELSEFMYDLRHPNPVFLDTTIVPLIERDPLLFWKTVSFILACLAVWLAAR